MWTGPPKNSKDESIKPSLNASLVQQVVVPTIRKCVDMHHQDVTGGSGAAPKPKACLTFDGESNFLVALMELFKATPSLAEEIVLLKLPAATSHLFQANDLCPCYKAWKKIIDTAVAEFGTRPPPRPPCMDRVEKLLEAIEPTSRPLYVRWMHVMSSTLQRAYT